MEGFSTPWPVETREPWCLAVFAFRILYEWKLCKRINCFKRYAGARPFGLQTQIWYFLRELNYGELRVRVISNYSNYRSSSTLAESLCSFPKYLRFRLTTAIIISGSRLPSYHTLLRNVLTPSDDFSMSRGCLRTKRKLTATKTRILLEPATTLSQIL